MSFVSDLPQSLQARLRGRDLIVFDGTCLLCDAAFRFVLAWDEAERFHFATAQSEMGQALYHALNLPADAFETNLVIVDGQIYTRAQAAGAVFAALGGVWRPFAFLRHLPRWSTDWAYTLIASNRFRLFGQRADCLVPDGALRSRFLT